MYIFSGNWCHGGRRLCSPGTYFAPVGELHGKGTYIYTTISTARPNRPSGPIRWKEVRTKKGETTFDKLKQTQAGHSKISHICYKYFLTQEYLKSHKLNNYEVSLLFSLTSRTARDFECNFCFYVNQLCQLGCSEIDTQEHILQCDKVYPVNVGDLNISYMDILVTILRGRQQ